MFLAGIWAGMHTVRYFDGKTYKWVGLSRQPNIIGKVSFEIQLHILVDHECTLFANWFKEKFHFLTCNKLKVIVSVSVAIYAVGNMFPLF